MSVVAVVGVGGLGCPAALCLARMGYSLRLIDEDRVERSNLHRQVLFSEDSLGCLKVEAARETLCERVSGAHIEVIAAHLSPDRAMEFLGGVSAVVEGTDNLAAKFLAADTAFALGVPSVHGAAVGWMGTVLPVLPGQSACYRCVFEGLGEGEDLAGSCATLGVFGPVTSVLGAVMAADVARLLGGDVSLAGKLLRYDGWRQTARATVISQRGSCGLCGAAGADRSLMRQAREAPAV